MVINELGQPIGKMSVEKMIQLLRDKKTAYIPLAVREQIAKELEREKHEDMGKEESEWNGH